MGLKQVFYRVECKGHRPYNYRFIDEAEEIFDELVKINPRRKVTLTFIELRDGFEVPIETRSHPKPRRAPYHAGSR